jgi:hypothetical protein
LKQPHRVIALLIGACFVSGNFIPTPELLSHQDSSMVVSFGCDKGGMSTNMLIRLANCKKGNGKAFGAVLASMSGGAECYGNLQKTTYKPKSPHLDLLQDLVLDKMFVVAAYIGGKRNEATEVYSFVVKKIKGHEVDPYNQLPEATVTIS